MQSAIDSLVSELKTGQLGAIEAIIGRKEQEQFFVDFKRTSLEDYALRKGMEDSDRNNLSKALSWFWNSEWGILIWWIEGKDYATGKRVIKWVDNFTVLLNAAISRSTIPAHSTVENFIIRENDTDWYVVTVIPKSNNTPHKTIDGKKEWNYYMRAWDSFLPVPHSVLAWMFWRRPSPEIIYQFTSNIRHRIDGDGAVTFEAGFLLRNQWLWIARDIFANAMIMDCPDSMNNTEVLAYQQNSRFSATQVLWRWLNCCSDKDIIMAPEQMVQPFALHIRLKPPFDNDLEITFSVGCEWWVPCKGRICKNKEELQETYELAIKNPDGENLFGRITEPT